jgi:VWFA-related protein
LLLMATPALAVERVTVDQLAQVLASAHGNPDAKVAQRISELELTERLSSIRLSRWERALPGPLSRRSLVVLADVSAFLDPPAEEIPATGKPDLAAQQQMMAQTVDYASKTIHQLPNFFATRDVVRFEGYRADASFTSEQPLRPVGRSTGTVLYRDGQEVVDSGVAQGKKQEPDALGLTTRGVFGPILGTVLVDAAHGRLNWSHWEQSAAGLQAVFRYSVPREKSHYEVEFCCVVLDKGYGVFRQFSGYHGEIAVDPANGTILRLTLEADMRPTDPILQSDILVEYGPWKIGDRTYICPVKNISISRAPTPGSKALKTSLNDVVFAQYHLFRSESRVLTANEPDETGAPEAHPAGAENADSPPAGGKKEAPAIESHLSMAVTDSSPSPAPTDSSATVASEGPETGTAVAPIPAPTPAPESLVPEIRVREAAGLPELPATPQPAVDRSFNLRVTTRLVDVGVVALDKKGHPITDLKPDEFEIYDNGRKQAVRFFSQAGPESAKQSDHAPGQPDHAPDAAVFSNRRAGIADAKPGTEATESSVTILLIDAGNLAWSDLTYARDEMSRFLGTIPANQRVGLYGMKSQGFQVLEEGTVDHALLVSKLRQWMPSAQDLARAQSIEQHNLQQFDSVLHSSDLQSVNGNNPNGPETSSPVDPKLRDSGSSERDAVALSTLGEVARHLAAMPGHKNLVWITSDNVLVDWTDKAVTSDKGGKHIEGFVLRAQEALNDAHVSVYPLDASQLEDQAIDASLQNRNIQLDPSVTSPPQAQSGGAQTGRLSAEMNHDIHPIQSAIQEMAAATGGRAFRRSGEIAADLNHVVADGRAAYLLGFTPDTAADDQYHRLTVKLAARRGVTLRYRTGYLYSKEPATLKDRFREAIWQPIDVSDIAVSANPVAASTGVMLKLNIATNDLALKQQGERWMDKLDIFLVQRDDDGLHVRVTGQTLSLTLKIGTYERLLQDGTPFNQTVSSKQDSGVVRIVVVDENSGRMGSVTIPVAVLQGKS